MVMLTKAMVAFYFDVAKYDKDHHYGVLSGRNLTDMINNSRELAGVGEKHNQVDFALWKTCYARTYHALAIALE